MKAKKTEFPKESLINRFYPADYNDTFEFSSDRSVGIDPDDVMVSFWTDFPGWVDMLFKMRNSLVKLVGLKSGDGSMTEFEDCIRTGGRCNIASVPFKNERETVMLLEDKHLDAYLSVYVDNRQETNKVYLITLVHFKNKLGRIYFFLIKPFHGIVVKSMLKRAVQSII